MPRKARGLSPLEVRRLARPGRWNVGGVDGLALQVTPSGARTWVLRITVAGKQREMGLGSFTTVTQASACLRNPMICSSVNLLFLMSAILQVGGLLLLQAGTAGGGQVNT